MKNISIKNLKFTASKSSGEVNAILTKPDDAKYLLILAHGAGAGINHPFMYSISQKLAEEKVAVFRYQFPYMEQRRRTPDPPNILTATVKSAVEAAAKELNGLEIFAGGKSLGGRMTSTAASKEMLPGINGIVFLGFPLHPPNRPSSDRAEHLFNVHVPMLFLQGTRDTLADLDLLKPICRKLKDKAELHIIDGADHSFHVFKSSGKTDEQVIEELAFAASNWMDKVIKHS